MGKGCGGEQGERAPQGGGGTRDSTPGLRQSALRELATAVRPVPPGLILGGVEQPKRRRRDRNRKGEKNQLPVAKPQTEGKPRNG